MASITIRNLDDEVKTDLCIRAARHNRSMEEEVRLILRDAVGRKSSEFRNLAEITRAYFGPEDEPHNGWVADAIEELKHIDEEVAEEVLPEISVYTKEKAESIILALPKYAIAPVIYPTMDGEIAIYFKLPDTSSSVLILVANDGQAACFSYIGGKNRRARYSDSSELPDEFVKEQLRVLNKRSLPGDVECAASKS